MKINFLKLYTPHIQSQLNFYRKVLDLPVKEGKEDTFQVQVGYSILEFQQESSATPYHLAFHIPALQEEKALQWLKPKVEILKDGDSEIIDFPGWKAKSIYFYDEDQNIVEFISRKDLFKPVSEEFTAKSLLGISEIGLATEDVSEKFDFLNTNCGLGIFTGDTERFCATGDDSGLFIVINKNQKDWIPTGDPAAASAFDIGITTEKDNFRMAFENDRLELK